MLLVLTYRNEGGYDSTIPFDYESKEALRDRLKEVADKYIAEWPEKFQICIDLNREKIGKSLDEINAIRVRMFAATYEPYFIECEGFELHITRFIVKEISQPVVFGGYNFSYFEPEIYTLDEWIEKNKYDSILDRQITPISPPSY